MVNICYSHPQVQVECIPPMCELLTFMNSKIVQVALSGLENILKSGELHAMKPNPYAVLIEECGGKKLETKYKITSPLCRTCNILHIFFSIA